MKEFHFRTGLCHNCNSNWLKDWSLALALHKVYCSLLYFHMKYLSSSSSWLCFFFFFCGWWTTKCDLNLAAFPCMSIPTWCLLLMSFFSLKIPSLSCLQHFPGFGVSPYWMHKVTIWRSWAWADMSVYVAYSVLIHKAFLAHKENCKLYKHQLMVSFLPSWSWWSDNIP